MATKPNTKRLRSNRRVASKSKREAPISAGVAEVIAQAAADVEAKKAKAKAKRAKLAGLSVPAPSAVSLSRVDRWNAAVAKAQVAKSDLDESVGVLAELRGEYEEWRDAMPESLQSSPTYEKLDAVCDLDIDQAQIEDALSWLDEADGIDLPVGFGRD